MAVASPQVQRPRLEAALEHYLDCGARLQQVTEAYREARALASELATHPDQPVEGLGLNLVFNGLSLPVPLPTDGAQRLVLVSGAVESLGQEVIRLWNLAHETTSAAKAHCDAAAAAAVRGGT